MTYVTAFTDKPVGDERTAFIPGVNGTIAVAHAVELTGGSLSPATACGRTYDSRRVQADDWFRHIYEPFCDECKEALGG